MRPFLYLAALLVALLPVAALGATPIVAQSLEVGALDGSKLLFVAIAIVAIVLLWPKIVELLQGAQRPRFAEEEPPRPATRPALRPEVVDAALSPETKVSDTLREQIKQLLDRRKKLNEELAEIQRLLADINKQEPAK